jgi:hypothetical protein
MDALEILQAQSDVEYSMTDIPVIEASLTEGAYGVANKLKEFIIGNCNMQPVMNPVVWGEKLVVPCNRHTKHGEAPHAYSVLDSDFNKTKVIHWSTVTEPDLKSFKRWAQTGLIHSLDSRVIDYIMSQLTWGIDIHDAVLCNPEDGITVRKANAKIKTDIYNDRKSILNGYFASMGIKSTAKTAAEWMHLQTLITPIEGEFECSMWCMK